MHRLLILLSTLSLTACGHAEKAVPHEPEDDRGIMQAPIDNDSGLTDQERKMQNRERLSVPLEERGNR